MSLPFSDPIVHAASLTVAHFFCLHPDFRTSLCFPTTTAITGYIVLRTSCIRGSTVCILFFVHLIVTADGTHIFTGTQPEYVSSHHLDI